MHVTAVVGSLRDVDELTDPEARVLVDIPAGTESQGVTP